MSKIINIKTRQKGYNKIIEKLQNRVNNMDEFGKPEKIANLRYKYMKKGLVLDLIPAIRSVVYRAENNERLQIEVELYTDENQTDKFDSIVLSIPIGETNTEVIKQIIVQHLINNNICTEVNQIQST